MPFKVLVHSGNKSLHAIVEVNANSSQQYKKRVTYIYEVCERNGLRLDKQSRNASRLSRLPGVERNGKKQFIVDIAFFDKESKVESVSISFENEECYVSLTSFDATNELEATISTYKDSNWL